MTFGKAITLLGSDQPPRTVQNKTVKYSEREEGEQQKWDMEQNGEHTEMWKRDKDQGSPALYIKVNWQGLGMCSLFYAAVFSHHHHNQFLLQFKATGISPLPWLHHHDHLSLCFCSHILGIKALSGCLLAWPGMTQQANAVCLAQEKTRAMGRTEHFFCATGERKQLQSHPLWMEATRSCSFPAHTLRWLNPAPGRGF